MGIVLKGLDTALNRYAAIKVLSPLLATSGTARKRFAREARAAAAVLHENVVAIDELEVKVAQLRAKLEQRRQLKQQIIDSRSMQLIREAQGLGWGNVRSTKRRTSSLPGLPGPGVNETNPFRRTTR